MNISENSGDRNQNTSTGFLTEETIRRFQQNQGYVYLVHAIGTDRYKIGRSVNPVARLQQLQGQSPYPLQIVECFWTPDAIACEKYLHEEFKSARVYGEWFQLRELPESFYIDCEKLDIFFTETEDYEKSTHRFKCFATTERPGIWKMAEVASKRTYLTLLEKKPTLPSQLDKDRDDNDPNGVTIIRYYLRAEAERLLLGCHCLDNFLRAYRFIENDWISAIEQSLNELGQNRCIFKAVVVTSARTFAAFLKGGIN